MAKASGIWVSDAIKYFPRKSVDKVCQVCREWLIEWVPQFKFGMAAVYFRKKKRLPQVRLTCPNGCKKGFYLISDPRLKGKL